MDNVEKEVGRLINDIRHHVGDQGKGRRLREGVRVAIVGQPNAGKSTLLNLLCKYSLITLTFL
jgi:tRNA U34 5-carboxymethylaminomethyl modifying GTPase MnmE/TrmE